MAEIDETNPADDSSVSAYPANERASRTALKTLVEAHSSEATGRLKPPATTHAARDAIGDAVTDDAVFNWAAGVVSRYNGSGWDEFGLIVTGDFKLTGYDPSSPPEGWLPCDGEAVSRTTYAALFAKIGTAFGVGDGSTTFNVPDFRGNVPVGFDSADSDYDTVGKTVGEKEHTLVEAEIPAHDHGASGTHTHNIPVYDNTGSGNKPRAAQGSFDGTAVTAGGGDHTHASFGGGGAHENRPPSLTVGYLIKT